MNEYILPDESRRMQPQAATPPRGGESAIWPVSPEACHFPAISEAVILFSSSAELNPGPSINTLRQDLVQMIDCKEHLKVFNQEPELTEAAIEFLHPPLHFSGARRPPQPSACTATSVP